MAKPIPNDRTKSLLNLAETLILGASGGACLGLLGIPAGWLSGAMLFVAVAAIAGRPVGIPNLLSIVLFTSIGISLGAVVTPETLKGVATWPFSIVVLGVATGCVILASYSYLRLVHGWDAMSAFLASTPGALSQSIIIAAATNADVRGVAVVQTLRVVILTLGIPAALTAFGVIGAPPVRVVAGVVHPLRELAVLIAAATATGFVLNRLKMRAGWMFGAMLASGFLHGTNYIHVILPWWVVVCSMVGLGALTGSRFVDTGWRVIANYIGAALGSFFVVVVVAMAFALALIAVSDFHLADVVVSFAPGALDTMMILALTLHFDPLYVAAHHLSRFIIVCLVLPFGVRAIERNNRSRKKPK